MRALLLTTCVLLISGCHFDTLFSGNHHGSAAPQAPPDPPTDKAVALTFETEPSKTAPGATMSPPVMVAVLDSAGQPVQSYSGPVTIAISRDASLLQNAKLWGTTTVAAVAGVATFVDLRIDQIGFGYILRVDADSGSLSEQSAAFDISPL